MRDVTLLKAIGPRLECARRSCGMTLRDASLVLGMSKSAISRLERGESEALVGALINMAALYGVSTDYLLFGIERYASCPEEGRVECRIRFTERHTSRHTDSFTGDRS